MVNYIDNFISLSVSLLIAAEVAQGLGPMAYIAIEDSVAISGGITSVSSPDDVATLLTATQISAQAAADLNAALAQNAPPDTIWIATYDSVGEDPTDALQALVDAAQAFGVIAQESRTDTDNSLIGAWLNASVDRRWRKIAVLQSATAGLITSGKPATLSDCEVESVLVVYHNTDAQPAAAGLAGSLAGHKMTQRPLPLKVVVRGVDLPTITQAELTFAKANDVCVLLPAGAGASAIQRLIDQTRTYGGSEAAAVFSIIYSINRMVAELFAMTVNKATRNEILRADPSGASEVRVTVDSPLASMAAVGHFLPGQSGNPPNEEQLPEGYRVRVTPIGTELNADVLQRYGPEATRINLGVTGVIVTGS